MNLHAWTGVAEAGMVPGFCDESPLRVEGPVHAGHPGFQCCESQR